MKLEAEESIIEYCIVHTTYANYIVSTHRVWDRQITMHASRVVGYYPHIPEHGTILYMLGGYVFKDDANIEFSFVCELITRMRISK